MPPPPTFDPVPDWLHETRLRQHRADGEPWTQDDLLIRMEQEIGWAPHRPNYSKYETGSTKPKPATLRKFIDFWAKLGEPGPDYTPKEETGPPKEAGLGELVEALEAQTKAISALVAVLGGTPSADADAAIERLVDRYMSKRHAPDPVPTGER